MRKMKFFAAIVIVVIACFALPMTVGATVEWNAAVNDPSLLDSDYFVRISDGSEGQLNYSGDILYVLGDATNLSGDIILNLDDVEYVEWDADINGNISNTVTIQGTVTKQRADYDIVLTAAQIVTSNASEPALTIDVGTGRVRLYSTLIQSTGNVALELHSPARIENCWYNGSSWFDRIISTVNTAVVTTANLEVVSSTISGFNGIVSTGDRLDIIDPTYTTVSCIGGGGNTGAQHAISVTGTAYLTGGTISTNSNDTINRNDSAVFTQNGTIIINGATITSDDNDGANGKDQDGVEVNGTGLVQMSDGNVSGYNGIYVKNSNGVAISGGSISGNTGVRIEGALGTGVVISGGTITSTGNMSEAGVYISGNNARKSSTIIRGTAAINGGSNNVAISMGNSDATLLIENGTFEAAQSALVSNSPFKSLRITGGTFRSTAWQAIYTSITTPVLIQPTVSTPVTLQGYQGTMGFSSGGSASITATTYEADMNYDGLTATSYTQSVTPFDYNTGYKYAKFIYTPPVVIPDPSYNVTVSGGTANGLSSSEIEAGTTVNIAPSPSPGKIFVGWEASGITLADPTIGDQSFIMPANDVTLTARFSDLEPVSFKVTFNTNGGTEIPAQTVEIGNTAVIPPDPERKGYIFAGWHIDDEIFEYEFDFTTPITENTLLHAYWIANVGEFQPSPGYNPGPSYNPPTAGSPNSDTDSDSNTEPSDSDTSSDSDDGSKKNCILVIATLNKSGSVNSKKTAEDLKTAHNTAVQDGIGRIFLKIPEGGTGISASTMKILYKAAGGTALYLIFDYYDSYEVDESEVYGKFYLPLNNKSGQILTGLKFDTANISSAQDYIENHWDTDILASFETKQKAGWTDTATYSVSIDRLGFKASNGKKLYALIYDTKDKKWYQTDAVIDEQNVVVKTTRSGVIIVVTDSVK